MVSTTIAMYVSVYVCPDLHMFISQFLWGTNDACQIRLHQLGHNISAHQQRQQRLAESRGALDSTLSHTHVVEV